MTLDFFSSSRKADPKRIAEVKQWVAEVFRLGADVSVMVTELRSTEPAFCLIDTLEQFVMSENDRLLDSAGTPVAPSGDLVCSMNTAIGPYRALVHFLHQWSQAGLTYGIVLLVVGCSPVSPPTGATSSEEHEHKAGQHGGAVIAVGRGHYHIEAVFEKGGILKLFLLGQDESRVIDVPVQELTAYVKTKDALNSVPVMLRADPQSGDATGRTSRFTGQLPVQLDEKELLISVPNIVVGGERFRLSFRRELDSHPAMPAKIGDDEEQQLYLTPGGKYTLADIKANGNQTASQKFKGFSSTHDLRPKPGDRLCPVTRTKANPDCTWIIGGEKYEFCCPPCVDEFVRLAKEKPEQIKPPSAYVQPQP